LNIYALVGARNGDEISANLQALQTDLSAEEMAWLNLERPDRP